MTRDEFLEAMQDVLQTEDTLTMETSLDDIAEWDSVAMMATMTFLDKHFGVLVLLRDFKTMSKVGDIAAKVGIQ